MVKTQRDMKIPSGLVPKCPVCGKPMTMNLRCDDTFVEDEGWQTACRNYEEFLRKNKKSRVLYLELGVGMNTPAIIKYPFRQWTSRNENARYVCVNTGMEYMPDKISAQSTLIAEDVGKVIDDL